MRSWLSSSFQLWIYNEENNRSKWFNNFKAIEAAGKRLVSEELAILFDDFLNLIKNNL